MPQTNDLHKYSQKNPGIIMIIKPNKFALLQFFIDFLGLIINISSRFISIEITDTNVKY